MPGISIAHHKRQLRLAFTPTGAAAAWQRCRAARARSTLRSLPRSRRRTRDRDGGGLAARPPSFTPPLRSSSCPFRPGRRHPPPPRPPPYPYEGLSVRGSAICLEPYTEVDEVMADREDRRMP